MRSTLLLLPVLLFLTPFGSERFWWIAATFALLVFGHLTYWFVTHPVNIVWLKDTKRFVQDKPRSEVPQFDGAITRFNATALSST